MLLDMRLPTPEVAPRWQEKSGALHLPALMPVKGTAFNKPGVNRKFKDACKSSASAARERAQARDESDLELAEALGLLAPLKRERACTAGRQTREAFKLIRAGSDPFVEGAIKCPGCIDVKSTHAITCYYRKQKPSEPEYSVWGELYDMIVLLWRKQLEDGASQASADSAVCRPCAAPAVELQRSQAAGTSAQVHGARVAAASHHSLPSTLLHCGCDSVTKPRPLMRTTTPTCQCVLMASARCTLCSGAPSNAFKRMMQPAAVPHAAVPAAPAVPAPAAPVILAVPAAPAGFTADDGSHRRVRLPHTAVPVDKPIAAAPVAAPASMPTANVCAASHARIERAGD
jgi:hypothetical protein